jgi:hypothetical protein
MKLNRKQMLGVLAGGGSVLYKDQHITDPDDVPSDAELAAGTERQIEVLDDIEKQIIELSAQRDRLKVSEAESKQDNKEKTVTQVTNAPKPSVR